jgi:hypothetical protein
MSRVRDEDQGALGRDAGGVPELDPVQPPEPDAEARKLEKGARKLRKRFAGFGILQGWQLFSAGC